MTRAVFILTISLSFLLFFQAHAGLVISNYQNTAALFQDTNCLHENTVSISGSQILVADSIPKESTAAKKFKSKKLIAAILSFPLPFGFIGLHRVVMGTKPYMPFVYIGTLGGCFFILPMIDFVAILSANPENFKTLENNPKVFMWSH